MQYWGPAPLCNLQEPKLSCTDKETQADECCTPDCAVIGLPETLGTKPSLAAMDPNDLSAGIVLTMVGEQPTQDDPYHCSTYDPSTGQATLRHTHFVFKCDPTVKGFANLQSPIVQDASDSCLYTFTFTTAIACQGLSGSDMSGGWAFILSCIVISAVYVGSFGGWHYYKTKEM